MAFEANQPMGANESPLHMQGKTKAAILLVFLGPEAGSTILNSLSDSEIEALTIEIAKQRKISSDEKLQVLLEFEQMMMARKFYSEGGLEYAKKLLEQTIGPGKTLEILNKMGSALTVKPFEAARTADPTQLASLIQNENPQLIAMLLAYLQPSKSAVILQSMSQETQVEIAKRLALMDTISPDVSRKVENYLEECLSSIIGQDFTQIGGLESLTDILNTVERSTEKNIIETMEVQEPALAEEIKKRLFVFEDVVLIDDKGIQALFKEIDQKDLSIALKGVTEEVRDKFFRNMSKRAAEMMKEEMTFMGQVRMRDVDQAQQRIVAIVKKLEQEGKLIIARPGEEEYVG